jgi:hypothetical protein
MASKLPLSVLQDPRVQNAATLLAASKVKNLNPKAITRKQNLVTSGINYYGAGSGSQIREPDPGVANPYGDSIYAFEPHTQIYDPSYDTYESQDPLLRGYSECLQCGAEVPLRGIGQGAAGRGGQLQCSGQQPRLLAHSADTFKR